MAATLTFDNPVFSNFAFYATVVTLKMMLMSVWTARTRIRKKIFANVEDVRGLNRDKPDAKPIFNDPDVERIRRGHLNDIENIIPFVLVGVLYVLTGPSPYAALMHFRVFAVSRILHTLVYQFIIPQPARALTFFTGVVATVSMAVQVLMVAQY